MYPENGLLWICSSLTQTLDCFYLDFLVSRSDHQIRLHPLTQNVARHRYNWPCWKRSHRTDIACEWRSEVRSIPLSTLAVVDQIGSRTARRAERWNISSQPTVDHVKSRQLGQLNAEDRSTFRWTRSTMWLSGSEGQEFRKYEHLRGGQ